MCVEGAYLLGYLFYSSQLVEGNLIEISSLISTRHSQFSLLIVNTTKTYLLQIFFAHYVVVLSALHAFSLILITLLRDEYQCSHCTE